MLEGWWLAFSFSGLSLTAGLIALIYWRDAVREKREKEEKLARWREAARRETDKPTTVNEWEEKFQKKA